eukprot:scaffold226_cov167-Pinguiococcus_pyrenoidosus.AAC.4
MSNGGLHHKRRIRIAISASFLLGFVFPAPARSPTHSNDIGNHLDGLHRRSTIARSGKTTRGPHTEDGLFRYLRDNDTKARRILFASFVMFRDVLLFKRRDSFCRAASLPSSTNVSSRHPSMRLAPRLQTDR